MGDEHDGEPLLPLHHYVLEKIAERDPDTTEPGRYPVGEFLFSLLILCDRQYVLPLL